MGFTVVDVDRLGHRALGERQSEVVEAFGRTVMASGGGIDRKALGEIVFADRTALRRLEAIIHPRMVEMVEEEIERSSGASVVVNAAILFQMGLHRLCDRVLWVSSPLLVRIARGLKRDRLSPRQVLRRIWAQRKLSPQPFRNLVDIYTVRNSGDKRRLKSRVASLAETGQD